MNDEPRLLIAATFTSVHEAQFAKSVLEAAGIEATLADEHVVSMTWTYSNAVGGVKLLVHEDRLDEAMSVLEQGAVVLEEPVTSSPDSAADAVVSDTCQRCGSHDFESRLPAKRLAILSWLMIGVPLGAPLRRRYCRQCGAPANE